MKRKPKLEAGAHGVREARLKVLLAARCANVEECDLDGAVTMIDDLDDVGGARAGDRSHDDARCKDGRCSV